jgi:hypothetical protein
MATKLTLYFFAPDFHSNFQCLEIEPEARIPKVTTAMAARFPSLGDPSKLRLFKVGHRSLVAIHDRYHTIPCR